VNISLLVQWEGQNDCVSLFSSRKRSGDIRQILAGGNVTDKDLQYLEVLGRGSCGTVYKWVNSSQCLFICLFLSV